MKGLHRFISIVFVNVFLQTKQKIGGTMKKFNESHKSVVVTAIPIGNFGKGRPLKKRAGVA